MKKQAYLPLLLLALLPLSGFSAAKDTVIVASAQLIGPYAMTSPYMTSEKNMKQAAFSTDEYLKENRGLIFREQTDGSVQHDEALPAQNGATTLRLLRFTLRTQRFMKPQLHIRNLRNYRLYVDGEEHNANTPLQLPPGETTVNLLVLTKTEDADTFRVELTGDGLAGLEVNATTPRFYMQRDMLLGAHYGNPRISPCGQYISYNITDTKPDGSSTTKTYLKETKSGKTLALFNTNTGISWMPRRDILYTTQQDARGRILCLKNPATMQETELAVGIPEGYFRISPTEDYLIYTRNEEGNTEPNGTKRIIDPDDRIPGWRTRTALYRYDIPTGRTERLTFGEHSVQLNDISLDGRKLLLSFSEMKPAQIPFTRTTVVAMDAYTGQVDTLLRDEAFLGELYFSPDASQILVKASPGAFEGIGAELKEGQTANAFDYRLFLYDISSKQVTPLLPDFKPSVTDVVWAAGDGQVYFGTEDGYNKSLFRLNPTTRKVERIDLPVTYLQSFRLSTEEKHPNCILTGQSALRAREMFLVSAGEKKPKCERIGEIDFDALTQNLRMPSQHEWEFRASRGDTIKGFYYLPADFDAAKQYPMIVYYYGGCSPTGRYLESYYPHASFANSGYVVLVLEPSGAVGFGQEFAARHVNTWGDESSDDIIEGVRAFVGEHPYVNAKKVGCMGASYGGFMTQYLQTRTDIFACAISHAGISDITAYWGGGYWGYTYGEAAEYGSFPWNNPDLFVKHSPLYNADKIHTPLLLLHGTVDTNVPTNQSQAMYTALRILDRPVAYVTVENQDHHILDWKKRMAWQQIINAWFALWLKDEPLWWNTLYPGDCFDRTSQKADK
ncbi:MAG: S9 family peptidase [Alloprevotella sp.]|nr:S9 family peptidase [Alloprevotella sp.]